MPGLAVLARRPLYEGTLLYNHRVMTCGVCSACPIGRTTERLKLSCGTSARFIRRFEAWRSPRPATQGYDGVICGHIHRANLCRIDGTSTANTGDWVESCSALVETRAGKCSCCAGRRPSLVCRASRRCWRTPPEWHCAAVQQVVALIPAFRYDRAQANDAFGAHDADPMETADLSHHISRRFNEDLERVRNQVLAMGGFVEQQLQKAIYGAGRGRQLARRSGGHG